MFKFSKKNLGSRNPYYTGNKKYFRNWDFALATEANGVEALKVQTKFKFYKSKIEITQELNCN